MADTLDTRLRKLNVDLERTIKALRLRGKHQLAEQLEWVRLEVAAELMARGRFRRTGPVRSVNDSTRRSGAKRGPKAA